MIIIPIIFFFINTTSISPDEINEKSEDKSKYTIYLVQYRWHTGLVFKTEDIDTTLWPEANDFRSADYLDAGWGDKEFYLTPGFDYELAFFALFYPTESTIRIEGIYGSVKDHIKYSDLAAEIHIEKEGFGKLLRYIHNTYRLNKKNRPEIITERNNGEIKYYYANGNYTLFNTCNTWVAKGLKGAGIDITTDIILAEQLFKELQDSVKILKSNIE